MSGGLAWAPDGSELFAVIAANNTGTPTYSLQTVSQPTITRSPLTLAGSSSAYITHAVTLTGNLSLAAGTVPAGTRVTVRRTQAGSSASATLGAHATVAPDKRGQCVMFEVQEYFQGSWQEVNDFGCVNLSKSSTVLEKVGLSQADRGCPYRIRADYVHKASDRSNANNDSAWIYLTVE